MGTLSNYALTAMLGHLTLTAYTPAATIYLALCTTVPTAGLTGATIAEVANSNNYSRKAIAFGAAASRRVTQSGAVAYDAASGSWGTIQGWAIVDSATHGAGNMLAFGTISNAPTVTTGNTPTINSADIFVEISSGDISNYAANGFLDRMFRNQAFTIAANYIGLTTAVITDANTGSTITEVAGGSYARVQINVAGGASPAWAAAAAQNVANADQVDFPTSTASWGTATSVFVATASTAGEILLYDNDMADQAISDASDPYFAAAALEWDAA